MLEKIKRLMSEYAGIYTKAWETQSFKHPIATMVRNDIAQDFRKLDFLDPNIYLVKASCGTGRFTAVPWIAVFDQRITDSAQKGVYIVYLLNKDTQELYLTLNQAATGTPVAELSDNAEKIRALLHIDSSLPIVTGSDAYDAGCILSKKYTLADLENEEAFVADLKVFLEKYQHYQAITTASTWWPNVEKYNPGISKEKWLELLNNSVIFTESALKMIAEFYTFGGTATCAQLAEHYHKSYNYYLMTSVHLAERVVKATGCPVIKEEKNAQNAKWWPVLYVGKEASKDEKGDYIWKIRDELHAALAEFGIEKYLSRVVTGIFDSWEILDECTAIKHCDKSFFDYRGSGVPKGICWFFDAEDMSLGEAKVIKLIYNGKEYQGNIKNESTDRRRVRIFWSTELGNLFDVFNVPDAVAKFIKLADDTYEVSIKGGEEEMTIKEKVAAIKAYIAAKGFNYEGDLIENFYLSLKSKPFVILAGTSGTGKTKLVEYFAEAIDAELLLVPVRPDWTDSSDLFGHTDLSNRFHAGAVLKFIKRAEIDRNKPYFLCLDEMNLARVEYYLSDFLSVIETRRRMPSGEIVSSVPLVSADYYKDPDAEEKYGRVVIPENLYIIGTVNMDETTFPFSKKVLDRANTIEFSYVDLMKRVKNVGQLITQKQANNFLKTEYLYLHDCDDEDLIDTICFKLEELNQILVKANLHVGYRVRDEISFYMMNNKKAELLVFDEAFDHEIMQKILPRVQGSSTAIKDVLSELFIKCAGDYNGFAGVAVYEQMNSYLESKTAKYSNSAKKIAFMMRRYEEDGFTSYWL